MTVKMETMEAEEVSQLVDEYYTPLYRFAYGLTGNAEDAADYTQQTFYLLQTKGRQVRDPRRIKSWLFSTLYHQFVDRVRKKKRFPHYELNDEIRQESTGAHPRDTIDSKTAVAALSRLDERYRAPLVLFYLESHSYREISEALDIPIGTVMSRLRRGKDRLRSMLEGEPGGTGDSARQTPVPAPGEKAIRLVCK